MAIKISGNATLSTGMRVIIEDPSIFTIKFVSGTIVETRGVGRVPADRVLYGVRTDHAPGVGSVFYRADELTVVPN